MIDVQKMFNLHYVHGTMIDLTDTTLFWNRLYQLEQVLPLDNSYYFMSDLNTKQEHVQKVYRSPSQQQHHLQLRKGIPGSGSLAIYPQYYCFNGSFQKIMILHNIKSVKQLQALLLELVHTSHVSFKVCSQAITNDELLAELNNKLRISKNRQTDTALLSDIKLKSHEQVFAHTLQTIYEKNEAYCLFQIVLLIKNTNHDELKQTVDELQTISSFYGSSVNPLLFEQLEGIEAFFLHHNSITSYPQYTMVTQYQKLITSLPLAQLSLQDEQGISIGRDCYNHEVKFDLWHKNNERVNSNFIILGESGQGKTNLVRILLQQQAENVRLIIVDPEEEYGQYFEQTTNYQKITVTNHTKITTLFATINIGNAEFWLQHFSLYLLHDDINVQTEFRILLQQFLQEEDDTFLNFSQFVQQQTTNQVIQQYVRYLSNRRNNTLSDSTTVFHFVLDEMSKTNNQTLSLLVYEILSFTWNCIGEASDSKYILLIDECYILFDATSPYIIDMIRNLYKRARKYKSAIGMVTQNIQDLRHTQIQDSIMTVFDNCSYKFLFRQGDNDCRILQELAVVTRKKMAALKQLKRGECYVLNGPDMGKVKVHHAII